MCWKSTASDFQKNINFEVTATLKNEVIYLCKEFPAVIKVHRINNFMSIHTRLSYTVEQLCVPFSTSLKLQISTKILNQGRENMVYAKEKIMNLKLMLCQ